MQRPQGSNGLNAVGKPFSPQYDPNYRMKYKPSYGHLRAPYGADMKFVGDAPRPINEKRKRSRQPNPMPLLDPAAALVTLPPLHLLRSLHAVLDYLVRLHEERHKGAPR